ncbi:MAG: hypothetical protein WEF53_01130 [Bacteroidota bacterium]
MKTMAGVFVLWGFLAGIVSESMAQTFWIRLSGNRVVLDARIRGVEGESLVFMKDGRAASVRIEEIENIRMVGETDILEGALIGAGTGLAVGAAAGLMVNPHGETNWTPATTALYGAVLGGIVGSVVGSTESPAVLELEGRGVSQKKEMIELFLEECSQ